MNIKPDQIIENNKAGMSALLNVAQTQFAAFERLSALNFNLTKSIVDDNVALFRTLLNAKDATELRNINGTLVTPTVEKTIAYTRGVLDVAVRSQTEINEVLEAHAGKMAKDMESMLTNLSSNGAPGSALAVDALRSAVSASTALFGRMNAIAKQANETAGANLTTIAAVSKEIKRREAQ